MNNISFGSTYRAYLSPSSISKNPNAQSEIADYLDKNDIEYKESFPQSKFKNLDKDTHIMRYTIFADDTKDAGIETFLANKGVDFVKLETPMSSKILRQVMFPPKNHCLTFVNVDKLEKFIKNQNNNFAHTEQDYAKYQKENTERLIKSGEKFETITLSVKYQDDDGTTQSLREYVRKYGADKLNSNSVNVWQETKDGNINPYYGMKDMGMKNIPVYLDTESYRNAYTLGLLDL